MSNKATMPSLRSVKPARRPDIDWLRAIAVLLLVPFHAALVFGDLDSFHITTGENYQPLDYFAGILGQCHMPLLFVISGISTWFTLQVLSPRQYASARVKRLFVPLAFGTLVIIPPQVYLERASQGAFEGSYLSFYPHFFEGIYPTGNFTYNHLWFILYLLVFSFLALPVFVWLKRENQHAFLKQLASICERRGGILALALPLVVTESLFRAAYPGLQTLISDWANFTGYLYLFMVGFAICCNPKFWPAIRRDGRLALVGGLAALAIGVALSISGMLPVRGYSIEWTLFMVLKAVNCWCWIVALLSAGMRWLNFGGKLLSYIREASYPFYILHQTVLILVGYYVMNWPMPVIVRFLIIVVATVAFTTLLYEVTVKRINALRFLFGMRKKPA
ncbi:MAG: acyltransferase family protein [Planctomycetales bacterium]|nr:acyltransferase family protein [Planctomycetales bacterium]